MHPGVCLDESGLPMTSGDEYVNLLVLPPFETSQGERRPAGQRSSISRGEQTCPLPLLTDKRSAMQHHNQ